MTRSGVDFEGVQFDATAAKDAAARLDSLADRLEQDLLAGEQPLTVAPAGVDEVSLRSAQTMTQVGGSFLDGGQAGVFELRKLAALVRGQVSGFDKSEQHSATEFGSHAVGA
ncbi:PE family protein [Nocardia sp. NPDC058705]|uniref:PE family protein n=1 Tax=Nocardia sp. NPDC058705 TaxID=3346609 RepID=UPI0036A6EBD3